MKPILAILGQTESALKCYQVSVVLFPKRSHPLAKYLKDEYDEGRDDHLSDVSARADVMWLRKATTDRIEDEPARVKEDRSTNERRSAFRQGIWKGVGSCWCGTGHLSIERFLGDKVRSVSNFLILSDINLEHNKTHLTASNLFTTNQDHYLHALVPTRCCSVHAHSRDLRRRRWPPCCWTLCSTQCCCPYRA